MGRVRARGARESVSFTRLLPLERVGARGRVYLTRLQPPDDSWRVKLTFRPSQSACELLRRPFSMPFAATCSSYRDEPTGMVKS